jgi:hypothetical protein
MAVSCCLLFDLQVSQLKLWHRHTKKKHEPRKCQMYRSEGREEEGRGEREGKSVCFWVDRRRNDLISDQFCEKYSIGQDFYFYLFNLTAVKN